MNHTIHTIWGWRDEGPELLDAWADYDVDCNYEGWQEAQKKAFDKTQEKGSGFWAVAGIRIFQIEHDYEVIEQAFLGQAMAATIKGDPDHPLLRLARRLEAMDNPENAEGVADRRQATLTQLIEQAREALDESAEKLAAPEPS